VFLRDMVHGLLAEICIHFDCEKPRLSVDSLTLVGLIGLMIKNISGFQILQDRPASHCTV